MIESSRNLQRPPLEGASHAQPTPGGVAGVWRPDGIFGPSANQESDSPAILLQQVPGMLTRGRPSPVRPIEGASMKQRVLVVEDDRRIADMVIKNLETAGYECHVSS